MERYSGSSDGPTRHRISENKIDDNKKRDINELFEIVNFDKNL